MKTLGVGVIGANAWADAAHLPGFTAYDRARLVAVCDIDGERARAMSKKYRAARVYTDHQALLADPEIELVDVCTPTHTHFTLARDAIAAGKHVLCEKPIAEDADDAFALAAAARARGVRTKTGFTFRYSPAIRQLQAWIADGTLGEIFHVHGFEQNSQFLDPSVPLRQVTPDARDETLVPSSIVGYGSHLVDLMRWCAGDFAAVCGSMRNFIPEREVRGIGRRRMAIEDGTVAIVEFASGAQGTLQTSFIAIGNYPGVELRVYGSKGAAIARLIVERGVPETLHRATADAVEFEPVALPASALAPGTTWQTPWPELYYRSLVRHFVDEILDDTPPEATFADGAQSQAIVDAVVRSHVRRGWADVTPAGIGSAPRS